MEPISPRMWSEVGPRTPGADRDLGPAHVHSQCSSISDILSVGVSGASSWTAAVMDATAWTILRRSPSVASR